MAVTLKSIRINNQISASYALTASYALNGGGGGGGGSVPANTVSSSAQLSNGGGTAFTTSNNITVGSVTGSLLGTSSFANAFNPLPTTNNTYLVYQDGILKWVPIVSAIVGFSSTVFYTDYILDTPAVDFILQSSFSDKYVSTDYPPTPVVAAAFGIGIYATGWTTGSL